MRPRQALLALERRIQTRITKEDMRALARIVDAATAETGITLSAERTRRRNS